MADKTERIQEEITQRLKAEEDETRRVAAGVDSSAQIMFLQLQEGLKIIEGKYIVEKLLSSAGGEADVYLCRATDKTKEKFVIKFYRTPNIKPKMDILDKMKGINHQDIVSLTDYGQWQNRFFEVMEYAEGGSLDSKMPFSEKDLIENVIPEVVNALHFLHSRGIIHRDLKPTNLFYRDKKQSDIVLGDFGISSIIDASDVSVIMTSSSRTQAYTAPEIFSGIISKGGESDYYSLGITLIHLLTGVNPFQGIADARIMNIHISEKIPLPDCSSRFKSLLQGLLVKERKERWNYDKIQRWLRGENVPVYEDKYGTAKPTIQSFKFKIGAEANSVEQLAGLMQGDLSTATRHVGQGTISAWLKTFDQARALEIGDVERTATNYEAAAVEIIHILDPTRPYYFTAAELARTPEQLASAIDRTTTNWQTGKSQLYSGQILAWLGRTGFQHLVAAWNSLDSQHKNDQDEGLEAFLHILDPELGKPILELNRQKVNFGWIEPGNKKSISVKISNKGRGYLTGSLDFEKKIDGISVSSHTFKGKKGDKTEINFSINTAGLKPGGKKRTDIQFESNAQNAGVTIPLFYRVAFPILKTLGSCLLWSIPGFLIPLIYQLANNYFTHRELLNLTPAIPLALLGILFFGLFVGLWKSANRYQVGYLKIFSVLFLFLFLFGCYNHFQSKLNLPGLNLGETPRWIKQNAITLWATIQSRIGSKQSGPLQQSEGISGMTGIVTAPEGASVRSAPDKNAPRIAAVAYNQRVTVLGKAPYWFKIKFGNQGTIGYIYEELISVPGWQGKIATETLPVKSATDENEPMNQPDKYYVMFESNPPGAVLFINDRRIGETPLMTTSKVTPINIRLELDGYQTYSEIRELSLEGINKNKFELVPQN